MCAMVRVVPTGQPPKAFNRPAPSRRDHRPRKEPQTRMATQRAGAGYL